MPLRVSIALAWEKGMNSNLINTAAVCIILSTVYLAGKEIWTYVQAGSIDQELRQAKANDASLRRLGEQKNSGIGQPNFGETPIKKNGENWP